MKRQTYNKPLKSLKHTALSFILSLNIINCGVNPDLKFLNQKSDKVSVVGEICTQNPNSITSPVRITLIVDTSGSMATTDPQGFRALATQEVINEFITPDRPNYEIMIVKYASGAEVLTGGFTRDLGILNAAVGELNEAEGWTNMPQAINTARDEIEQEILSIEQEFGSAANAFFPSILLADGAPIVDNVTKESETLFALQLFMNIKNNFSIGDIVMNAAFLGSAGSPGYSFMQQVAQQGNGIFLHFTAASDITFLNQGINLAPLVIPYILVDMFVVNMNAAVHNTSNNNPSYLPDTDMDFAADLFENTVLNSSPLVADTDGDKVTDMIEYRTLSIPAIAEVHCTGPDAEDDLDQDGLNRCHEEKIFSEDDLFDSDEDNIIDLLEAKFGTDPSINDANFDNDGDGWTNIQEIKAGMNPNVNDAVLRSNFAIRNSISFTEINNAGLYCYQVDLTNITLTQTQAISNDIPRTNEIRVYMLQKELSSTEPKDYILSEGIVTINIDEFFTSDISNEIQISQIPFVNIENPE